MHTHTLCAILFLLSGCFGFSLLKVKDYTRGENVQRTGARLSD